jgi:hypothetical protein
VKGVAQAIDALAGIAILAIFLIGGFSIHEGEEWRDYQYTISAEDLGYSLERSGVIEDYVESSDYGDIQSVISTVSGRTIESSLVESSVPTKLDVGMHVHNDEVEKIQFAQMNWSTEECMSGPKDHPIPGYSNNDDPVVVKTLNNSGNLVNRTGVELILDQIDREENRFGTELNYNALWVKKDGHCNFKGPFFSGENFYWGNRSNSKYGGVYQFYMTNTTSTGNNWRGKLEVHKAAYVENITDELEDKSIGFKNYADVNTFHLSDSLSKFDILIFRNKTKSVDTIEQNLTVRNRLNEYLAEGNILFQANLDKNSINDYHKTLEELAGFRWYEKEFNDHTSAKCGLNADNIGLESGCKYNVSFPDSRAGLKMKSIFEEDLSGKKSNISLPVNNTVYSENNGPLSAKKPVYLENYNYKGDEEDITKNLDDAGYDYPGSNLIDSGDACNEHSGQVELFPSKNDNDTKFSIIGENSNGNCDDYFVGIEGKNDRLYTQGEKVNIRSRSFEINILDKEDLELKTYRIPNIGLIRFNYMNKAYPKVGLTGYQSNPSNYTKSDYKLLASVLYYLSLPHESEGPSSPERVTETTGSIGSNFRPYRIRIGWDW